MHQQQNNNILRSTKQQSGRIQMRFRRAAGAGRSWGWQKSRPGNSNGNGHPHPSGHPQAGQYGGQSFWPIPSAFKVCNKCMKMTIGVTGDAAFPELRQPGCNQQDPGCVYTWIVSSYQFGSKTLGTECLHTVTVWAVWDTIYSQYKQTNQFLCAKSGHISLNFWFKLESYENCEKSECSYLARMQNKRLVKKKSLYSFVANLLQ